MDSSGSYLSTVPADLMATSMVADPGPKPEHSCSKSGRNPVKSWFRPEDHSISSVNIM